MQETSERTESNESKESMEEKDKDEDKKHLGKIKCDLPVKDVYTVYYS
jgi:hypothetical protein